MRGEKGTKERGEVGFPPSLSYICASERGKDGTKGESSVPGGEFSEGRADTDNVYFGWCLEDADLQTSVDRPEKWRKMVQEPPILICPIRKITSKKTRKSLGKCKDLT